METRITSRWVGLITFLAVSVMPLSAQDTLHSLASEADAALEQNDWAKAEGIIERILNYNGSRDRILPPTHGILYFKKGWCELKQEKWKEASQSFETCYKYPGRKTNPFQKEALRGWGDAAVGAKDLKMALRMYKKYIRETSTTNWDNPFGNQKANDANKSREDKPR